MPDEPTARPFSGPAPTLPPPPPSEERRTELAPKLRVLLADLGRLDELVTPEGEPATPWPWADEAGGDADG